MYAIQINQLGFVQQYRVYTLGQFAADTSLNTAPDINGNYWVFVDEMCFLSLSEYLSFPLNYLHYYYNASKRVMIYSSAGPDTGVGGTPHTNIQEFMHPGSFNLVTPPGAVSYTIQLLVGGGGGGGRSSEYGNGWCFSSGGSGGIVTNVSGALTKSVTMKIVIGQGGLMEAPGGDSVISLNGTTIATATGGIGWSKQEAAPGGTPNGTPGTAGYNGTDGSNLGVNGANSLYGVGGKAGDPFATPFTPGYLDKDGQWVYQQDPDDSCDGGDASGYGAGGGSAGWRTGVIPIGWNNNGQTCPSWCLGSDGKQEYQGFQWRGGQGSSGYAKIVFYFT